jgi:hypothetical protein
MMTFLPDRLALKLIIGIGCALLLALLVQDRNRWKAKTAHYAEQLAGERAAHAATIANYRAAADQARRADAANAARVKAEQAAINERSKHRGGGRAAPLPGLSAAAGRAAEATGEDRLSDQERLIATEQAIQLDALIQWVIDQGQVRTGEPAD